MRIEMHTIIEQIASGQMPMDEIPRWATPFMIHSVRAPLFRMPTIVVEAAKRPVEEQSAELIRHMPERKELPYYDRVNLYWFVEGYASDLSGGQIRGQAMLRVTATALAAERYRREHGHLPPLLTALTPVYLRAVPLDPYDGQPLRYRENAEGVVIYSIGSDGEGNGGEIDRQRLGIHRTDLGVQLWR